MATITSRRKPKYFFLAFGEPYAREHPVEGGLCPHLKGFVSNSGIVTGDVMLLYCCDYYPGHEKEAPGIRVVTGIQIDTAKETLGEIAF